MWPSQRGSLKRSQGHRPCWRCRSATLVCRTVRDKEPGLPEMALSSKLSLESAPLSSRPRRSGFGCHLSLDSMDNGEHYHKMCQPRQRNLGRNVCCPLCSWHSLPLKFPRGPRRSRGFFAQLHISVPPARNLEVTSFLPLPTPPFNVSPVSTSYFIIVSPDYPFATSLHYNTVISCLKIAVFS